MIETGKTATEAGNIPSQQASIGLNDGWIRLIFIPLFGIGIPNVTGLFGSIDHRSGLYWAGYGLFVLLSFLIWHGNRFFLLRQRQHLNWFSHPIRKIMVLVFANIFYTAPLTVAILLVWEYLAGHGTRWNVIEVVTLMNVIAVAFITHVYETVYLIRQRENDLLVFEKLERAKAQAELEALKSQVDPHFMFNSLNTLSFLIEHDRDKALQFNDSLADVYRYILQNRNRDLVYLKEEIEFVTAYVTLLRLRFGDGVRWSMDDHVNATSWLIPPISLQILIENAVKHNRFDEQNPLPVDATFENGMLTVRNPIRERGEPRASSKLGLKLLGERYELVVQKPVRIRRTDSDFEVCLPLVEVS